MDMQIARYNMVEQQIKPMGVLNTRILEMMLACRREDFVPTAYKELAYADTTIPLGNGRYLLPPNIIGRMLQALHLNGTEQILEISTGSGYLTVLLAQLGRHVTSIENNKPLAVQANKKLGILGIRNVEIINGNPFDVLRGSKAFDVITITSSIPSLPFLISNHLNIGGRLFVILGHLPVMQACIFTRINEGEWTKDVLFETVVPPLKEMLDVTTFEF